MNGVKVFKRFLKEKGIYIAYFREVKRNNHRTSSLNRDFNGDIKTLFEYFKNEPTKIIDRSLIWEYTEQGSNFWAYLDDEFRDYYNSIYYNKNDSGTK